MSWIVQSLLNKRTEIKSTGDIESDDFNDLLMIEDAVTELHSKGVLTNEDLDIIKFFGDGGMQSEIKEEFDKYRTTIIRKYNAICERIAFFLGGTFTNDGYIDYMVTKYNLSEEQEKLLRDFIKSRYKNKVMRSTYNE